MKYEYRCEISVVGWKEISSHSAVGIFDNFMQILTESETNTKRQKSKLVR